MNAEPTVWVVDTGPLFDLAVWRALDHVQRYDPRMAEKAVPTLKHLTNRREFDAATRLLERSRVWTWVGVIVELGYLAERHLQPEQLRKEFWNELRALMQSLHIECRQVEFDALESRWLVGFGAVDAMLVAIVREAVARGTPATLLSVDSPLSVKCRAENVPFQFFKTMAADASRVVLA